MASGAMCSGTPPLQVLTLAPLASLQDARGITRRRSADVWAPAAKPVLSWILIDK